jgi:hypothetical protein
MTGMSRYYVTRSLLCVAVGAVIGLGFSNWWLGVLTALATFASFVWIARSGRYVVRDETSAAPMRTDEMSQAIRTRAARDSFAVQTLYLSALVICFGLITPGDVPVELLSLALALSFLVYVVSDWRQRR